MFLLTIDIGNTAVKLSVFEDERLVHAVRGRGLGPEAVDAMLDYCSVDGIAYCAVGSDEHGIRRTLEEGDIPFLALDQARLPVEIDYLTPSTLGQDRIAAAIGAVTPGGSALVVDAGTALTCDAVVDGRFVGGNISPGVGLRFESLHQYTARLPLVGADGDTPQFGVDTETAIRAGVVGGVTAEIVNDYRNLTTRFADHDIKLILTGGDARLLAPLLGQHGLDPTIDDDAVGRGLVRIYNYNDSL